MLKSAERYTKEVLEYIKNKMGCDDEEKIRYTPCLIVLSQLYGTDAARNHLYVRCRNALEPQRLPFLKRVETLIKLEEQGKSDKDKNIQERIRQLGRCPMDYEWIRQDGGWQCAGGSHWLSDADLENAP